MEMCSSLIHEAKMFHEMKLDIADFANEERFKPRLSTGIHEIFVRIGGTNAELDELSVLDENWYSRYLAKFQKVVQ